jgi:CRP/FNR family transcriptional regulator
MCVQLWLKLDIVIGWKKGALMERIPTLFHHRSVGHNDASCRLCGACALRSISVCGAIPLHGAQGLRRLITVLRLQSKQVLFIEDETVSHHFTIVEGVISVAKSMVDGRRQILGFLFPGDFVGFSSDGTYSCTAQAVTNVKLCRFPRRSFEALTEESSELKRRLLHAVSTELIEAQKHMLMLGRQSAEERLASFLLHLSERASQRGEPDTPVHLPMSRGDIGDYLGLTIETVSRTLTGLSRQGVVALPDVHTVELRNREKLIPLANGTHDRRARCEPPAIPG